MGRATKAGLPICLGAGLLHLQDESPGRINQGEVTGVGRVGTRGRGQLSPQWGPARGSWGGEGQQSLWVPQSAYAIGSEPSSPAQIPAFPGQQLAWDPWGLQRVSTLPLGPGSRAPGAGVPAPHKGQGGGVVGPLLPKPLRSPGAAVRVLRAAHLGPSGPSGDLGGLASLAHRTPQAGWGAVSLGAEPARLRARCVKPRPVAPRLGFRPVRPGSWPRRCARREQAASVLGAPSRHLLCPCARTPRSGGPRRATQCKSHGWSPSRRRTPSSYEERESPKPAFPPPGVAVLGICPFAAARFKEKQQNVVDEGGVARAPARGWCPPGALPGQPLPTVLGPSLGSSGLHRS